MIGIIRNYNRGACFIGRYVIAEERQTESYRNGVNCVRYSDGKVWMNQDLYEVDASTVPFFEALKENDVVEVADNGLARLVYSDSQEDATLFITSMCNSNCVMCPSSMASRRRGEIPETSWLLEILRHYPNDTRHITITGGEPFLMGRDLFRLLSYIRSELRDTEVLLLTNGRVFCLDEYVQLLVKTCPQFLTVGIPLHGSTAELHDLISAAPGSFWQTTAGISKLIRYHIPVELRIVVSRLNAEDMDQIAELIMTHLPGVYTVHFIGLEMLGNAAVNSSTVWLPYAAAFHAIRGSINKLVHAGINVALYNFPLCSVERRFWSLCRKSISDYKRDYPAACAGCAAHSQCGGIFAGSRRFAEQDLKPFEEAPC